MMAEGGTVDSEAVRLRHDLDDLKEWLVHRAGAVKPRLREPYIEAAERIAWVLAGTYRQSGRDHG